MPKSAKPALKKAELEKVRKAACEAAIEAGKITLRYFRKRFEVREKARSSLVTEADMKSEALIRRLLTKKFPGFQFRGEEGGENTQAASDAPMWHVDPLDGTTNFVHGFPMYCVSIGLALGDEPLVGVIHIPTLGETYHGAKGSGALLNRQKLRVSQRKTIGESLLTTGFAYMHKEEVITPEQPVTDSQGRTRILRVVKRPLRDDAGRIDRLVGVALDITDLNPR